MNWLKMTKLSWLERVWLVVPVAVWFSYQPLIRLGQDGTSYYELSLALIYVVILAMTGLKSVWRAKILLFKQRPVWLVGSFVLLSWLSLLWTPSLMRGVLTAGIISLLFAIFLAGLAERDRLKKLLPVLGRLLIISAVVMSLLALLQVIAGIWLSRDAALLCAGCVADQFGFVRPNVFAIEPQFFGSLLLAPLLILLHKLLAGKPDKWTIASFLVVALALFMTLSRGAIFAFALGAIILLVLNYRQTKKVLRAGALLILVFGSSLLLQGSAAALNPRVEVTFGGAISASLNQLSLGLIDISANEPVPPPASQDELPAFDGYVPESTDTRMSLSRLAIGAWADNPARTFFGIGLGGSGAALHEKYPGLVGSREIVQNEYVELLLEYGVVGFVLFAAIIGGLFSATRRQTWVWALIAAYLFQWIFFSGYPNALHIYLVLIGLYTVYGFEWKLPVSGLRAVG